MKRLIISSLLIGSYLCVSAQGHIDMEVTRFKEENDSLKVSYTVRVSSEAIKSSQLLELCPCIESSDQVSFLPEVTIIGNNKAKVLSRNISLDTINYIAVSDYDTLLNYSFEIPYDYWMDTASLVVNQKLTEYRNRYTQINYKHRGQVELSAREPYQVSPSVAFIIPQKEVKIRKRQGKAYLDFQVGRSVILPNYRRNPEELLKINEAIRDVVNNPDAQLQGLYIEGYASPEGSYALNERLSRQRAEALKEYIRTQFNLSGDMFKVNSVAEDWLGLEELVKASEMAQKEAVLEVITGTLDYDAREQALKRFANGVPYRSMLREMFPELRRVEYQIDYTVKDYDVAQTALLLEKNPGDLSQLELYNLAQSYEVGSKEYNHLMLEIIPRYFADDATANNNAAAVLINNGEWATAKRLLDKAENTAEAENNKGIILLLEGELDLAAQAFDKAQQMGSDKAALNAKELELKREDNIKQERYSRRNK